MKRLLILGAVWALALARPELYKEKEDFQFSRSSSDDGTKSGFYGAQRGNMGGNFERAHNMDSLAQSQMSGLVRQVDGELGDGAKTRTGSVYSAANSRGTYGSGHVDLSNLGGRNFQESASYGDSQSQASHSAASAYNAASYTNSQSQSSRHSGYQATGHSGLNLQSDNLQALDQTQGTGQYDYGSHTGHAAGYNAQSGFQQHTAYDASNTNLHSGGYGSNVHTRLISATPVRIVVRPGTRVAIPVAAQTYELSHGSSQIDQNSLTSDAAVLSNDNQRTVYRPSNAKHYESSYNYRKEWEKHDTIPSAVIPSSSTDNPFPRNSELYEEGQARTASDQYNAHRVDSQRAHSAYSGYNANVKSTSGQSRVNYDTQRSGASLTNANTYTLAGYGTNHQESSSDSSLNAYNIQSQYNAGRHHGVAADALTQAAVHNTGFNSAGDLNSQVENLNAKPKSYHSAYSYHKSWERQGDPYVIKPASGAYYDGQSSQRLTTGSTQNLGYLASGSHYQHSHASGADCDENGHIRVARSYNTDQVEDTQQQSQNLEDFGQQQQSQNLEDFGQQQQQSQNLEDFGQQQQQSQNLEDFGQQQQSQNLEDFGQQQQQSQNLEDFGQQQQQSQNLEDFGQQQQQSQNLEDFGQQQQQSQNLEDFSQQQQSQNLEDFSQQQQSQNLDYFGQQQQSQKQEDLGQQQHQRNVEDLGQQVENLGQQSENVWYTQQETGQQAHNTWDNLESLSQQSHKNTDIQHTWDKFEDLGQRPQDIQLSNVEQNNQNDLGQRTHIETKLKNNTQDEQAQDQFNKFNQQETQPQLNDDDIFNDSQQSRKHNDDQMSVWDKFDIGSNQNVQQNKYNREHTNSNGNQVISGTQQTGLDQQPLNSVSNPDKFQSVNHKENNGLTAEQTTSNAQQSDKIPDTNEQSNTEYFNIHDGHSHIQTNQNQFWNNQNSFQETLRSHTLRHSHFVNSHREEQTRNSDTYSHVNTFDTIAPNTEPLSGLWNKLSSLEQTLLTGNVDKGEGNVFSTNTQSSYGNSMHEYHNMYSTSQDHINSARKPNHDILDNIEKDLSQDNKSNDTKTEKESSLDVGRGDISPEDLLDLKLEKYPSEIPVSSETLQNQDTNNVTRNNTNAQHYNRDLHHHENTHGLHNFHQHHDFQEQKDLENGAQQNLHVFSLHENIKPPNPQDSEKDHNLEQHNVKDYPESLEQQNQQDFAQQENNEQINLHELGKQDNLEQQNLQDFGQQVNVQQQDLQDFGQQENLEQLNIQDFGQQENLEQQNLQDFGKQDNLEQQNLQDFGQQVNLEQQNLQDFGTQDNLEQQNIQDFRQMENLEQQNLHDFRSQDDLQQQNKHLEQFNQDTEQPLKYPKEERTAVPINHVQSQDNLLPPEVIEHPIIKKQNNDLQSIPEQTSSTEAILIEKATESTGFWKSVGNKFTSAKNKIASWF